jgi:hypothetical protein
MKKAKRRRIVRYLKVSKRKARRLTRKKVYSWIEKNLKAHPLILGVLFFVWATRITSLFFEKRPVEELAKFHLKFHALLIVCWLGLVLISRALKDRQKTAWYFRKRFVFVMLLLFVPVGLILMWVGASFKRKTKIAFTIVFALIFIAGIYNSEKRSRNIIAMSPIDRVVEMIVTQKSATYLKKAGPGTLKGFTFTTLRRRRRVKLPVSELYARYSRGVVSIKTKDKKGEEIGLCHRKPRPHRHQRACPEGGVRRPGQGGREGLRRCPPGQVLSPPGYRHP